MGRGMAECQSATECTSLSQKGPLVSQSGPNGGGGRVADLFHPDHTRWAQGGGQTAQWGCVRPGEPRSGLDCEPRSVTLTGAALGQLKLGGEWRLGGDGFWQDGG
jgi:hypothetical protein